MNNAAAIGYMIIAAIKIGLDNETISNLVSEMYKAMDLYTEEEAEEFYRNI